MRHFYDVARDRLQRPENEAENTSERGMEEIQQRKNGQKAPFVG